MNYLDYSIIAVYIVGFLYLGYHFKEQQDGNDYFLGGRNFSWPALTLSTVATQLSAISFISAPAFVGLKKGGGLIWLTYEFAVPLAMLFLMVFLIPPLFKSGIVSVYAYLEKRFSPLTRLLLSIVFQISRAFATSVMIYATALILSSVMGMPMWQTILIMGAVTMIYSFQGGMKAVIYGDVIQMLILMAGIVICLGFGLHYLGGWDSFVAQVDHSRLSAVNFTATGFQEGEEFGFWPMVLGGCFLYVAYYGTDQSQVQRLFSAPDMRTVRSTLLANGLIRFPITLTYCIMGLVIGTMVMSMPAFREAIPADKPDLMIPVFIRDYLPQGIRGVLIVAIFSAAMSSLSSAINSLSAASIEDLVARRRKLDPAAYMRYSRWAVLFWGTVCMVLAFFTGDIAKTVIEAINKIGSVFYGPILATFIAAVGIRRIHATGANAGLLAGVTVNIFLWLFVPSVFWFWWNFFGAVVTFAVGYLVSILTKPRVQAEEAIGWEKSEVKPVYVYILAGFFVAIVLLSVGMPHFF
ncbi:MAG: sodium:solute symporter [Lewinellaceae bacterium]|nr:sodium:solute symporter [Lewinellaceae bacterium]